MLFTLALEMGRPVAELRRRLSIAEFTQWLGFFVVRREREEAAAESARENARGSRR